MERRRSRGIPEESENEETEETKKRMKRRNGKIGYDKGKEKRGKEGGERKQIDI